MLLEGAGIQILQTCMGYTAHLALSRMILGGNDLVDLSPVPDSHSDA
jgi:hypothetical protein